MGGHVEDVINGEIFCWSSSMIWLSVIKRIIAMGKMKYMEKE